MIFRRAAKFRAVAIWRVGALLAAALLPVAIMGAPAANAAPRENATALAVNCPSILFLGAHGVDEGTAAGSTQPELINWGPEMQTVWDALNANGVGAQAQAVGFPKTEVDLPTIYDGLGFPQGAAALVKLTAQIVSIQPATTNAAAALVDQMWTVYTNCGDRTAFMLAGYSQGAWAIDIALRQLAAEGSDGAEMLADIKGVLLMGDPAWPVTSQDPNRAGLATWGGKGYSSAQAYLDNGVSNFRSMCVSYPGGHFDPVCLGLDSLNPLNVQVEAKALAGFTTDLCIHYSYASSANYQKYNNKTNNCLGVTGLSNGIATTEGNWLATLVGGSDG